MAENAENFLNIESQDWPSDVEPLLNHKINKFKPLMTRVEPDKIEAIVDASKENLEKVAEPQAKNWDPIADTIEFD